MKQAATVHFQDILDGLEAFELQHADWLNQQEFESWNLWSILKKPLFYAFKHQQYTLKSSDKKPSRGRLLQYYGTEGPKYAAGILKNLLLRRHRVAFLTHAGNKQEKEGDAYIDKFVDPVILTGAVSRYVYFEHRSHGSSGKKAKVEVHFNNLAANLFIRMLAKRYAKSTGVQRAAAIFSEKVNEVLSATDASLRITPAKLANILGHFLAEYRFYKKMWRWLQPAAVCIVDGIPRGVLAASRERGIPVYEFQHGFISHKKADYIIPASLLPAKGKMVLPTNICVFGQFFKDIILQSGFWQDSEIRVIGNYLIEKARQNMPYQLPDAHQILNVMWATQPTTFKTAQELLQQLAGANSSKGVRLYLKMHPLEPASNIAWYQSFAEGNEAWCSFISGKKGFIQSLQGKHLLVSFHSTALLEAVALGYPVVSLATERLANGMADLVHRDISDSVRTVRNINELQAVWNRLHQDREFAWKWHQNCMDQGAYFYAPHYQENILETFKGLQK